MLASSGLSTRSGTREAKWLPMAMPGIEPMSSDFLILLHGTAPRIALLEQFRETPNAVLFGTSSFWQGVDVQGEALSCVIIDRLPFAVPSDPVVAARMKAIEESGGKPFFDYQVLRPCSL